MVRSVERFLEDERLLFAERLAADGMIGHNAGSGKDRIDTHGRLRPNLWRPEGHAYACRQYTRDEIKSYRSHCMPLKSGKGKKAFSSNIKTEMAAV